MASLLHMQQKTHPPILNSIVPSDTFCTGQTERRTNEQTMWCNM